ILCLHFSCLPGAAAGPDIQSLLDRHEASLGLIQTLTCSIQIRGGREISARYYQSGQEVHLKETHPQRVADILVKGGLITSISTVTGTSSGGRSGGGIEPDDGREISMCDFGARVLLKVREPNGGRYVPFTQLVKEASKVAGPLETTLDGKQLVAVDLLLD